ncbi:LAFA_0G18470g1_1 [Lachancea sp. 'fantastica']|nr:LAFA_0G18470g1_1 [Lachancea sp. 'fantastica']
MRLTNFLSVVLACLTLQIVTADPSHTNNWAVLVCTSRFWFNYRHMANVLSMYRTVKRLGIPDSQIILMMSDDVACNSRNLFPGSVFNNQDRVLDLYGESVEVDYKGYEVTVENFIRLLTDRWGEEQPKSKRLLTDENSNIFIYMTGHGGADFLKFQDAEEIASQDIADAFAQMHEKKRYNEIFFMIDTCQANSMYSKFYSPNVLAVGSSRLDESSYSHHSDVEVGVAVIDRFTYYTLDFMENIAKNSSLTLQDLFDFYTFEKVHSHVGVRTDLYSRDPSEVLVTDFFGSVKHIVKDTHNQENDFLAVNDSPDGQDKYAEHIVNLAIDKSKNNPLESSKNSPVSKANIMKSEKSVVTFDKSKANNMWTTAVPFSLLFSAVVLAIGTKSQKAV